MAIPLSANTKYESIERMFGVNVHVPAAVTVAKAGETVVVLRAGPPPHTAERVGVAAPPPPPVEGAIKEITEAQDAPTGEITLEVAKGKFKKFTVVEETRFQRLYGTVIHGSNFLREHRSRESPDSRSPSKPHEAAIVQILF